MPFFRVRNNRGPFGGLYFPGRIVSLYPWQQLAIRGYTMAKERLVVIGGDAAGMSAASQAKRRRPDLEIVVFERSPHTSFSA